MQMTYANQVYETNFIDQDSYNKLSHTFCNIVLVLCICTESDLI